MVLIFMANAQSYKDLFGYVNNSQGAPLCSAVVVFAGTGKYIYTLADDKGYYTFKDGGDTVTEISTMASIPSFGQFSIKNGTLSFLLLQNERVHIGLYDLQGRLVTTPVNQKLSAGNHRFILQKNKLSNKVYIVRAAFGTQTATFKYLPMTTSGFHQYQNSTQPKVLAHSRQVGLLRVSSPGYLTKVEVLNSFVQTDFALDTLISEVGTHVFNDGCMDRMTIWGKAKFYWGDIGLGNNVPLVKIIYARSHRVVDAAIIFNPVFVDLTYGENAVGWNKHTFKSLVGSDHVEFAFLDTDSATVFHAKMDLLSETKLVSSGYASLGVTAGDGKMIEGSASDVYSWGTSFDDNINYYGYELFESSPETDSLCTPNPNYPKWEYYVVYHICVNTNVFAPKDFADVFMSFVHASPSKNGPDTVPVTFIIDIGQNDPFINVQTFTVPDIASK